MFFLWSIYISAVLLFVACWKNPRLMILIVGSIHFSGVIYSFREEAYFIQLRPALVTNTQAHMDTPRPRKCGRMCFTHARLNTFLPSCKFLDLSSAIRKLLRRWLPIFFNYWRIYFCLLVLKQTLNFSC